MGYFMPLASSNCISITVANNEILTIFKNYLQEYYNSKYDFSNFDFNNVSNSLFHLLSKDEENNFDRKSQFIESFNKLFLKLNISKVNEHAVHDLFFCVCCKINNFRIIGSDIIFGKENYQKRTDIVMIDTSNKNGIIIEIKYNKSCEEALKQINDNNYTKGFYNKEFTDIEGNINKLITVGFNLSFSLDNQIESQIEIIIKK